MYLLLEVGVAELCIACAFTTARTLSYHPVQHKRQNAFWKTLRVSQVISFNDFFPHLFFKLFCIKSTNFSVILTGK